MNEAGRIRQFVFKNYVSPARSVGQAELIARAGDVHRAMGLSNALPNVCGAIGGRKFEQLAGVTRSKRLGPRMGANVYFYFDLRSAPSGTAIKSIVRKDRDHSLQPKRKSLDLAGAVVLVSCVKSKGSHRAPARLLYTSPWFKKVRRIVEASGARWYILSARYGLVKPNAEITPYEQTLKNMGVAKRKAWAKKVLDQLLPKLANEKRVVMFAGDRYREFIAGPLLKRGVKIEVPMAGLPLGEQLAWLSGH